MILWELFYQFFKIGLFSFGGGYAVIPLIREQIVFANGWLSSLEFTDMITISQMTPGPIAVNTSTFTGFRIASIPGSMAATMGCIIPGFIIAVLLYLFFSKHKDNKIVFRILESLKSISVALIASAAGTILLGSILGTETLDFSSMKIEFISLAIFVISFILLRLKKSPMLVICISGGLGILAYGIFGLPA